MAFKNCNRVIIINKPFVQNTREIIIFEYIVIAIFVFFIVASFVHGWYFDLSKPQSGTGWTDQSYYFKVSEKLATGTPLTKSDFHYQMGYSLLGSFFYHIIPTDPFMPVSFLLLMISMLLLYNGAEIHFNKFFKYLFLLVVFFRIGDVRALYYAQEIFLIPWNNQVLFLSFSYFFWAFSIKSLNTNLSKWVLYFASIIAGFTVATREESIIFLLPLLFVLFYKSSNWRDIIISILLFLFAYAPNAVIKLMVFGSFLDNVRPSDYGVGYWDKLSTYLSYDRLSNNLFEVIFDSSYLGEKNVNRKALLQSSPWFWLSPIGLCLFLIKNRSWFVFFVLISVSLLLFYLAGENMSADKLKFHCLRYISPSFIVLAFMSVYTVASLTNGVKK